MSTSAQDQFYRYATAVGVTLLGPLASSAFAEVAFDAPYATGDLPITGGNHPSDDFVSGAWTWNVISGQTSDGTLVAPSTSSIYLAAAGSFGVSNFEFKTTIVSGFESISFNYDLSGSHDTASASWFVNGTVHSLTTTTGTVSQVLAPGDIFGFRVSATYDNAYSQQFLTVSNLVATSAVPEPAAVGSWIGAGVAGLIAMRELRRRRRETADATTKA